HGNAFTNRVYQKVSEVDRDLAYREIQEMSRMGIVARPSGRYSRTYFVVEPAASKPIPDDLTSILDILSARGYVTNKDLRQAWGISRATAWKRAKELVTEGFLRQEGEKRGTRYYPTDKLQSIL
ncbi:MAG: winged helix-turn-helix transcriptional regulator, partial [Anaerolineae bacterium]|nr:winged helix-turn-helix transcriptional regulator [Anaerolineae bacterium]